jgi:hypothetical protein
MELMLAAEAARALRLSNLTQGGAVHRAPRCQVNNSEAIACTSTVSDSVSQAEQSTTEGDLPLGANDMTGPISQALAERLSQFVEANGHALGERGMVCIVAIVTIPKADGNKVLPDQAPRKALSDSQEPIVLEQFREECEDEKTIKLMAGVLVTLNALIAGAKSYRKVMDYLQARGCKVSCGSTSTISEYIHDGAKLVAKLLQAAPELYAECAVDGKVHLEQRKGRDKRSLNHWGKPVGNDCRPLTGVTKAGAWACEHFKPFLQRFDSRFDDYAGLCQNC